jgi:ParB/RepB/Spo0J family partition protein
MVESCLGAVGTAGGGAARLRLVEAPLAAIVTAGTGREPDAGLRESMARYSLLEPVDLRARGEAAYELIGGSRRRIAAAGLGWSTITAIVEPAGAAALPAELKALLLNLHRESLQQLHLARQAKGALARLECTQAELARRLGIGRSTLCQMLAVLACTDLVRAVEGDGLEFGAAKRMTVLLPRVREALLAELRDEAARTGRFPSVREVEARVRERQGHAPLPVFAVGQLADLLLDLEARSIPVRIRALPGKRSRMEVNLWLDDADAAALHALREEQRCSHGGTTAGAKRRSEPTGGR